MITTTTAIPPPPKPLPQPQAVPSICVSSFVLGLIHHMHRLELMEQYGKGGHIIFLNNLQELELKFMQDLSPLEKLLIKLGE